MTHHTSIKIETPNGFPYPLPDGNWNQQIINQLLIDKGAYFLHPEGSPYLGLTIDEQKTLSKMRRPPGRIPTWITNNMRKATKQDYEKLLLACTEALIHAWNDPDQRLDYVNVYVKVMFNWRKYYSKDIPRPFIVAYDDWTVTLSFRVNKIVDWLHSKGKSPYAAAELRRAMWDIMKEQDKIEFYYDIAAPQSIVELYSDIVDGSKDNKRQIRSHKGRKVVDNPQVV